MDTEEEPFAWLQAEMVLPPPPKIDVEKSQAHIQEVLMEQGYSESRAWVAAWIIALKYTSIFIR